MLKWLGLSAGKFHAWRHRKGIPSHHNSQLSRSSWIEEWERQAIIRRTAITVKMGIDCLTTCCSISARCASVQTRSTGYSQKRVISDNGPQFIARDFKEFIRVSNLSHVRTSPHYPQSNGKLERWHGALNQDCIRPKTPLTLEDGRVAIDRFITYYNNISLHSAIGYITPAAMLAGRSEKIAAQRTRKLEEARYQRKSRSTSQAAGQETLPVQES